MTKPQDKGSKPSPKQVYYLARLLCQAAEVDYPATRSDASKLIETLVESTAKGATDDCPF